MRRLRASLSSYDIFRRDALLFTAELNGAGTARLDVLGRPRAEFH